MTIFIMVAVLLRALFSPFVVIAAIIHEEYSAVTVFSRCSDFNTAIKRRASETLLEAKTAAHCNAVRSRHNRHPAFVSMSIASQSDKNKNSVHAELSRISINEMTSSSTVNYGYIVTG